GPGKDLDRSFLVEYRGPLVISPRYERLVRAVLGSRVTAGVDFAYPSPDVEEEEAIAKRGIGIYVTVTGGTARDHGLLVGERLFPSETVLLDRGERRAGQGSAPDRPRAHGSSAGVGAANIFVTRLFPLDVLSAV
ncbi:MAG: hypothetical protein ABEJ55_07625, partial [Halanaeroarchaeum sp.]